MKKPAAPSVAPTAAVTRSKIEHRVMAACLLTLVALGLMVWALVSRMPIPVVVAMSVGQVIGTLSLAFFLASVLIDVRATYKLSKRRPEASPAAPATGAPADDAPPSAEAAPPSAEDAPAPESKDTKS